MRVLEAFAGAGGAALGLHRAGFDHVACVEYDRDAAATLAAAGFPAVCADVREYQPTESPDVLWASPPCQAWSSAGKRLGAADERNGWPWTFDLVDRAKPTWLVCENVPRLLHHKGDCDRSDPLACPGCYWLGVILPAARQRFAHVEARTLDAADFGVPQRRHRVILVCGPGPIQWPKPTHSEAALALSKWQIGDYWQRHGIDPVGKPSKEERKLLRMLFAPGAGLKPWRTVRDALDLAGVAKGRPDQRSFRELTDEPSTTVASDQIGNAGPFVLDAPMRSVCAGGHANGRSAVSANAAIRRRFDAAGIRRLSVAECATLQDFPPDHPWQGTKTAQYRQVGNAVPATLARVVGEAIMAALVIAPDPEPRSCEDIAAEANADAWQECDIASEANLDAWQELV